MLRRFLRLLIDGRTDGWSRRPCGAPASATALASTERFASTGLFGQYPSGNFG
jgi:hypothetical protein